MKLIDSKQIQPQKDFTETHYSKTQKLKRKKILKATRKELLTYKGILLRLSVDFSAETWQAWNEWVDTCIFKVLKEKSANQE